MTLPALVAAVITSLLAGPITSRQDDELSRLTVPAARLPKGCRLAPLVRPDASGKPRADFGPHGPDPWIGKRPASMATIRYAVEGRSDSELQGPRECDIAAVRRVRQLDPTQRHVSSSGRRNPFLAPVQPRALLSHADLERRRQVPFHAGGQRTGLVAGAETGARTVTFCVVTGFQEHC